MSFAAAIRQEVGVLNLSVCSYPATSDRSEEAISDRIARGGGQIGSTRSY